MIDTNKLLLPLSDTKKNIVLLLNGCFNPIHNNHIRLLEFAREHLNSLNIYHIIGGYISPTHDVGIQRKLSVLHLTWQNRLEMCSLAVHDSSWIMVDEWQISQEKNHGAQQSKQHLNDFLRKFYPSIEIVSICGGDALPKLKSTFKKELVICIINRPVDDFDFNQWFQSSIIKPYHNNIILLYDNQSIKHISSTYIRQQIGQNLYDSLIDDLHPLVINYHQEHGINYRSLNETILWSEFDENDNIELGQGRCATVYAKQYKNEQVAVKVIRERKQFEHESKILTLLSNNSSYHKNLIRIFGIGDQFCVMEKCDIDLLSYIKLNRISINQTLKTIFPNQQWFQFIEQMLAGFIHLISLGILHRDIKTDNILLSNMIVKISDFSVSINVNSMTKMPLRGSIRHYAPEAIEDKKIYTEKADVYMFGCLLYEIVHGGERIWSEKNTHDVVNRRLNGEKPIFSVQCEPWYIDTVVHDCWAMNCDERPTFEQLLEKIHKK
jgi:nicotinate (nicotinamide) nucleotide adenylyltransferase